MAGHTEGILRAVVLMSRQADILNILERFKSIQQPERNPEGTQDFCLECGKLFYRLNENQIYCDSKCSNRHRQKAFRKRKLQIR
jgi:hypothetical protein